MKPTVGFSRRFCANIIDSIILLSPFFLIDYFLLGLPKTISMYVWGFILPVLYFPVLEASAWKASLGQKCLRMCVCSLTLERLTFDQAFKRQIVRAGVGLLYFLVFLLMAIIVLVSFTSFSTNMTLLKSLVCIFLFLISIAHIIIYFVRFFNNGRQTAIDYYSDTLVVYADS